MLRAKYEITPEYKLRKHCKAIRENQVSVLYMLAALLGYEVHRVDGPRPDFARECLDELGYDGVDIWACSTKAGGIWTTPQRHMLKTGEIVHTDAANVEQQSQMDTLNDRGSDQYANPESEQDSD